MSNLNFACVAFATIKRFFTEIRKRFSHDAIAVGTITSVEDQEMLFQLIQTVDDLERRVIAIEKRHREVDDYQPGCW